MFSARALLQQYGFSLIELLFTVAIAAVMFGLCVPAYNQFFTKSKESVLRMQLLHAINLARREVIMRGEAVTLCGSSDHVTCSEHWGSGQILFVDEKEDGRVIDKEHVISVFYSEAKGTLHWRSALGRDYLQILPDGLAHTENGSFWFCPVGVVDPVWAIVVNKAGRAYTKYPDRKGKINTFRC